MRLQQKPGGNEMASIAEVMEAATYGHLTENFD